MTTIIPVSILFYHKIYRINITNYDMELPTELYMNLPDDVREYLEKDRNCYLCINTTSNIHNMTYVQPHSPKYVLPSWMYKFCQFDKLTMNIRRPNKILREAELELVPNEHIRDDVKQLFPWPVTARKSHGRCCLIYNNNICMGTITPCVKDEFLTNDKNEYGYGYDKNGHNPLLC